MGMGKPNMVLDFTYYLRITWYSACAMQILSISMEILGPKYLWNG